MAEDWQRVQEGLEVKWCPAPTGEEVIILCRSAQRHQKEQAMHERFERRIEEGLHKIEARCRKRPLSPVAVAQQAGRLRGQNPRAAGLFLVEVRESAPGVAELHWASRRSGRIGHGGAKAATCCAAT